MLVVIGILIAVSVNNWNQRRKTQDDQLRIYSNIVDDLRKDSLAFNRMMGLSKLHLQTYYHIYYETIGKRKYADSIPYDLLSVTKTFRPTARQNHLSTIEKIQSDEVRILMNDYFFMEYRSQEAADDFNRVIKQEARPYLNETGLINLPVVFHPDMYEFYPQEGTLINYEKLKAVFAKKGFKGVLSNLRLGIGYFISELELLQRENAKLIQDLQTKISSGIE